MKLPRAMDNAEIYPISSITEVFKSFGLEDICDEIDTWKRIAISDQLDFYREASQREDLMTFFDEIEKLIEGIYLLYIKHITPKMTGRNFEIEETYALNEFEIANPVFVLISFFDNIPIHYVRLELWDCLNAVISYEGEIVQQYGRCFILSFYEFLRTLVDAAYTIVQRNDPILN